MTNIFSSSGDLDYPQYFPETGIDFLNNRSIPPEYTFTRNSAGTYVGADGLIKTAAANEPRFEYDPITGEFKGLLVEEARTNYAQAGINGTGDGGTRNLPDGVFAPDGSTQAILINPGNLQLWFGGLSVANLGVAGEKAVLSYYAYSINESLSVQPNTFFSPYVSVVNTTIPGKWVRIYSISNLTGNNLQYRVVPYNSISYTQEQYDAGERLYIWGTQVEKGSFPTSYIPTSGSAVTRQPDQLVLNRPFNSLGTFFIESNKTTGTTLSADNGTSSILMSSPGKEALYYNTNRTLRMLSDSIPSLINTTQPPQDLNRVSLGFDRLNNTNYINGYLKKFMYYGSPVTEDNLRSLTGNTKETFRYNNDIVTDGLVLNLDAGNRASYPGSGTTWFDLSGSGNDGTLVNGVGYSDSSLVLDGTNDFISNINPNLLEAQVEGNLTYEYWLQPTQSIYNSFTQSTSGTAYYQPGTPQGLVSQTSYKYNNQTFAALLFSFGTNGFVAGAHNFGYAPPFLVDYQSYTGISHLIVIKNVYGCSYYVNGVFKKTATQSKILGVDPIRVTSNRSSNFGTYFKGNIYSYKLYSKALTAQEIQQNFEALRGRFGI